MRSIRQRTAPAVLFSSLLSPLCLGAFTCAAEATPAACPAPPTKTIRIVNNTNTVLNLFIQAPIYENKGQTDADLWMQSQCGVDDWVNIRTQTDPLWNSNRKFTTTRLYRAYIEINNASKGIAPKPAGRSNPYYVDVVVPFYTQLKQISSGRLGLDPDQYIDWWNANRIYIFDSAAAYNSAKWTNNLDTPTPRPGGGLPQPDVKTVTGAAVLKCVSSDNSPCSVVLKESAINVPDGVPFQLQEYTMGSALGPPLNNKLNPPTRTSMESKWVNYNVSSLDSVFLSVAMGPLGRSATEYVGSAMSVADLRAKLGAFSNNGGGWPFYVPAYFDSVAHTGFPSTVSRACSVSVPFPQPYNFAAYNLPKIPGTFNLLTESYQGAPGADGANPPIPPILSSNPANWTTVYKDHKCIPPTVPPFVNPPALGNMGKKIVDLWGLCLNSNPFDNSQTCTRIRALKDMFLASFTAKCTGKGAVPVWQLARAVYGWVPITYSGCTGANLALQPNFATRQREYCELQYNYLDPVIKSNQKYLFNPYTAFIHSPASSGGLESSAYAFSIDDALSFKHVESTGVIIAVGGSAGLVNQTGQKIPTTVEEALKHCRQDH
jgi:hypothetical protein